jgi:hypothetical protein
MPKKKESPRTASYQYGFDFDRYRAHWRNVQGREDVSVVLDKALSAAKRQLRKVKSLNGESLAEAFIYHAIIHLAAELTGEPQ